MKEGHVIVSGKTTLIILEKPEPGNDYVEKYSTNCLVYVKENCPNKMYCKTLSFKEACAIAENLHATVLIKDCVVWNNGELNDYLRCN